MLHSQIRPWLKRISAHRSIPARRRSNWRETPIGPPAEVLECRQLLTVGVPYLAWVVQPTNLVAGHAFKSFTVDVMQTFETRVGIRTEIDTAFTGAYTIAANGPGVLDASTYPPYPNGAAGDPITSNVTSIDKGVGTLPVPNFFSLDVAGTYTLTATAPASLQLPGTAGISGNAVSAKFTVTPDTATDHLVFTPTIAILGLPTSVTVAVEDQFGNIDKSVSNVLVTVIATPGTASTGTLNEGEASVKNVIFAGPSPGGLDFLLALAFDGTNVLVGDALVPVNVPTGG